jgi:hypothetical protein
VQVIIKKLKLGKRGDDLQYVVFHDSLFIYSWRYFTGTGTVYATVSVSVVVMNRLIKYIDIFLGSNNYTGSLY